MSNGYLRTTAPWQEGAVHISRMVGYTTPKKPKNLTNFGLPGRETDDRRESKSLQAKSETLVSVCDHCPTMPIFTEYILVENSIRSIVLPFPLSRLERSAFTKNTSNWADQAVQFNDTLYRVAAVVEFRYKKKQIFVVACPDVTRPFKNKIFLFKWLRGSFTRLKKLVHYTTTDDWDVVYSEMKRLQWTQLLAMSRKFAATVMNDDCPMHVVMIRVVNLHRPEYESQFTSYRCKTRP